MAHIDTSVLVRGAVWIRPTGDALKRIGQALRLVRKRFDGPPVTPHIALLSGIEATDEQVKTRLERLAHGLAPFVLRLGRVEGRHEYYRALFAVVEASDELTAARELAAEIFEARPADAFEPHVSLAYGDLHEPLRSELAAEIGALDTGFTATAVSIANATADRAITDWRVLHEAAFGRR